MLDVFFDQLIKATLHQNKKIEEQLSMKLENFDKLYYKTQLPFDDRLLTIRWVKIPTFIKENKPTYYAVFLVDIEYWRKGELKQIYRQIIESIDSKDIDSHTIYLIGRLHGYFDKMDRRPQYYHVFRVNTDVFTIKERKWITDSICNFLENRIQRMTMNHMMTPDIDRIQYFIDTFRTMPVIMRVPARHESMTSHRYNEVIANTLTNTSHRSYRGNKK